MRLDLTTHLPGNISVICNKMRSASWNCHSAPAESERISHAGRASPAPRVNAPRSVQGPEVPHGTRSQGLLASPARCRQQSSWALSAAMCHDGVWGCRLPLSWLIFTCESRLLVPKGTGSCRHCASVSPGRGETRRHHRGALPARGLSAWWGGGAEMGPPAGSRLWASFWPALPAGLRSPATSILWAPLGLHLALRPGLHPS